MGSSSPFGGLPNLHNVPMVSSYFLHNSLLFPVTNAEAMETTSDWCRGEEAMNVKEMVATASAVLAFGMRSLVTGRSLTEQGSSDEGREGFVERFEKNVLRKFFGEEVIVFAAVASAYLLAWAASRVFQP